MTGQAPSDDIQSSGLFDPNTFLYRVLEAGARADSIAESDKGGLSYKILALAILGEGDDQSEAYKAAIRMVERPAWKDDTDLIRKWQDYVQREFEMVRGMKAQGFAIPRVGMDDIRMFDKFEERADDHRGITARKWLAYKLRWEVY